MANWLSRNWRARLGSATATWFDPLRWSPSDAIMAVSALVLAVSLFVPWFEASVRIGGSSVTGFLIDPKGTVSGIAAHTYLWVVFAVALLQFVVLAARHFPPTTWTGGNDLGDGFYIVVSWSYGAVVALAAAVVSLAIAVSAIRDQLLLARRN